jgi:hypothetical protein
MVLENTSSRLQMTSDLLIKSTYAGEPASRLKMARTCRAAGVSLRRQSCSSQSTPRRRWHLTAGRLHDVGVDDELRRMGSGR